MERLKNKKVFVGKYSKEIQEKAFELGFKWDIRGHEVSYIHAPFIQFEEDGCMSWTNDTTVFYDNELEEISVEYILSLNKKPQWKDFGELTGCYVNDISEIEIILECRSNSSTKNLFPSYLEAKACLALSQLLQWRDKYNDGWKADWNNDNNVKYTIRYCKNEIMIDYTSLYNEVLAFKSEEIRDKFLEDFRELIEIAKPLL